MEPKGPTVRCKFTLGSIKLTMGNKVDENGKYVPCEARMLEMYPVTDGSPENKAFFASTPGGKIEFQTVNGAAVAHMQIGKTYYIDISPAE